MARKVIIMGAAGRDFHNFNMLFRDNPDYEVVAFTATQIPDIAGRKYPVELTGKLYPNGIPIYDESELPRLIKDLKADEVMFAYSDQPHEVVMNKGSMVIANGADFVLAGWQKTALKSSKPVISVTAVRTGCGKSQTTRAVIEVLRGMGKKVVSIRHPMPYGDLAKQAVQRFATYADLDTHKCTIEEREEYEPHIDLGAVIYSGVDYGAILKEAEKEADIVIWDGGNNDLPFIMPNLAIVVVDPLRPGHEISYHPGEANLLIADTVVINKIDSAYPEDVEIVRSNIFQRNPKAMIVEATSPVFVEKPELIKGKRVLVVEDGPTLTHGEMTFGAGFVAARKAGAGEIIAPKPFAVGSIAATFEKYCHVENVLPAMGYSPEQIKDLKETIDAVPCDVVVSATPIDITRVLKTNKPIVRVGYELGVFGKPTLEEIIKGKF
ncbi:MAG TPA: cyclic 2,3-diphosphoglycerate synthase [Caldisericia bacterium]|nr:GTPase [Caldisericia bacterium]HOR47308.1 cyclic 2,3-diphosphoglycerate synthase [Caldisericia bacterium]HOU08370.1 cyclic 2,3-diphosphoglycerate synthase [Caldisericia bacterium]HPL89168.1 cyclic 2,3-diphosphoglycerate synthase [Caldisericia bacterium]HQG60125.1 cyclic 2,3-diphosphoglycerate synthase [Caldisericia bacterium]